MELVRLFVIWAVGQSSWLVKYI